MQVFKAFLKSTLKFMPQTAIYFVIFTTIALMIAHAKSDAETSGFQTASLQLGIIDEDASTASLALKNYLNTMHKVTPIKEGRSALLDRLFYRDIDYILVIPKEFEKKLLKGDEHGLFETIQIPGIYSSTFIDEQINTCIKTIKLYLTGGYSLNSALENATKTLKESSNQVLLLEQEEKTSPSSALFYFFQFIPYVLTSMVLSSLTPILTIFWEKDLSKRISCSSASLLSRNLQLALGSIICCFGIWGLFILTSGIFEKAALMTRQGFFGALNSFLLVPLAIAISLIISCFSPKLTTITMLNNIICLGTSFTCGVFVPQQFLGENVLAVSKFLPFYWYIKNNNMIFGYSDESFQPEIFWRYFGIQALFAAALFAVALAASKYKNTRHQM